MIFARVCPIFVVMILIGLIALPADAVRQRWLPTLTAKDRELMHQLATDGMTDKTVGTALTWENPESGNRGIVKLLSRGSGDSGECREIEHRFKIARERNPQRYLITMCLQPDGSWKWP